ncbi:8-amino-7-oxononanoate synthase [Diplonema papillatum]|nr:8-amino-7-oxononanoate synthase [Diplonema papillatum]
MMADRDVVGPLTSYKGMQAALERRSRKGLTRALTRTAKGMVDFSSNDYLGLARSAALEEEIEKEAEHAKQAGRREGVPLAGSSGSRLLSGNSAYAEQIEEEIAREHGAGTSLLFNSGYTANLAVASCIPQAHDLVLFDEHSHNSIREGLKLTRASVKKQAFRHNDVSHLDALLSAHLSSKPVVAEPAAYIFVETVYSMEGDVAPLADICRIALKYYPAACVVVDEAHGCGVMGKRGRGVVDMLGLAGHPSILCSVHTFGKAFGVHGAAVVGAGVLKQFLLNYARPLIYTTSLPVHSLASIRAAYRVIAAADAERAHVGRLISAFTSLAPKSRLLPSVTPIQAVLFPSSRLVLDAARVLRKHGFDVLPIRPPTVPEGKERLRIVIHAHNTEDEIRRLVSLIDTVIQDQDSMPAKL